MGRTSHTHRGVVQLGSGIMTYNGGSAGFACAARMLGVLRRLPPAGGTGAGGGAAGNGGYRVPLCVHGAVERAFVHSLFSHSLYKSNM